MKGSDKSNASVLAGLYGTKDMDEQDSDLCPVCRELPIPELNSCSCWWCPDCGTTNPERFMVCGGCGCTSRPDYIGNVLSRLIAWSKRNENNPHYDGESATLREAVDIIRRHALPSDHPLSLD